MTNLVVCAAGIDVGRDYLDVAVAPAGRARRMTNEASGIASLMRHLQAQGVRRVALEAIGPYAARLIRALADAGFELGVVDPRRIKAWRAVEGRRAKNDRLDAELIARFALAMPDIVRPVPELQTMRIRALSSRRRQIVEMIAVEKTRLKQAIDETIMASHRQIITLLGQQRQAIETELASSLEAAGLAARGRILQTAPGVGPAVSMTLLADLPELGSLDRRAIASLAGLAPHITQSGANPGHAAISGGRPCVRSALYLSALSAIRLERGFKAEYLAMRAAGKPAKVAIIAIARKLLVTLNLMVRNNTPWNPRKS
jgi:transposase